MPAIPVALINFALLTGMTLNHKKYFMIQYGAEECAVLLTPGPVIRDMKITRTATFFRYHIAPMGTCTARMLHGACLDRLVLESLRPQDILIQTLVAFKIYALTTLGCVGALAKLDTQTLVDQSRALQRIVAGSYNAFAEDMFVIDISGISVISKAVRFRVASRSGSLDTRLEMTEKAQNSQTCATRRAWH